MTKIKVVAQAPYPVAVDSGRHLLPGEVATIERTPEVESQLTLGFLRQVREVIVETPSPKEDTSSRKPRAATPARETPQEDQE